MNIARKIMFVMLAVAIFCLTGGYFLNTILAKRTMEKNLNDELQVGLKTLTLLLDNDVERLRMAQRSIANDARTGDLLKNQDAQGLLAVNKDLFATLRSEFRMTHMYFFNMEGECILRVHNPKSVGGKPKRATFVHTMKTGELVGGMEMGTTYFSLRIVGPVFQEGKVVGYLECAMEIDHIFNVFKTLSGFDAGLLLDLDYMESMKAKPAGETVGSFLLLEGSDKEALAKVIKSAHLEKNAEGGALTETVADGLPYVIAHQPFSDAGKKYAGEFFIVAPIEKGLSSARDNAFVATGITAGMFLLLLFVLRLIFRRDVLLPLNAAIKKLDDVGHLRFDTKTAVPLRYEMSRLGQGIEVMESEVKGRIDFLQGIMATLPLPYFLTDEKGQIVMTNKELLELLGEPGDPELYAGKNAGTLIKEAGCTTLLQEILASGQAIYNREFGLPGKKGVVPVQASMAPVYGAGQVISGAFGVFVDLTQIHLERRRTQENLEAISRTSEESGKVSLKLDELARQLSHYMTDAMNAANIQREEVQQAVSVMQQMESATSDISHSVQLSAESSESARQRAEEGKTLVLNLSESIASVKAMSETLKESMGSLGAQAQNIGNVLQVITDIADQTNLLALNAAIEAARAGDAGRGFAVVADEVRKLAENTMTATREVASVIRIIQESAHNNVEATDRAVEAIGQSTGIATEAGELLSAIVDSSVTVAGQINAIANTAQAQSANSADVSAAVQRIYTLAEETTETMKTVTSLANDLGQCSMQLSAMNQQPSR